MRNVLKDTPEAAMNAGGDYLGRNLVGVRKSLSNIDTTLTDFIHSVSNIELSLELGIADKVQELSDLQQELCDVQDQWKKLEQQRLYLARTFRSPPMFDEGYLKIIRAQAEIRDTKLSAIVQQKEKLRNEIDKLHKQYEELMGETLW